MQSRSKLRYRTWPLQQFDATEFPFAFLQAFGNKETTIKRLRAGASNKSDLGGVLQTNNIHIAVAQSGEVTPTLAALRRGEPRDDQGESTIHSRHRRRDFRG